MRKKAIILSVTLVMMLLSAFIFTGCNFGQFAQINKLNIRINQLEKELEITEFKGVAKADLIAFAEEQGRKNYTDDAWAEIEGIVAECIAEISAAMDKEGIELSLAAAKKAINTVFSISAEYLTFNLIDHDTAYEVSVGTATTFGYTKIVIPNTYNARPVTRIADGGFGDYLYSDVRTCSITNVVIPQNVTSIGYGAFFGCHLLKSVVIQGELASIKDNAFYNCYSLTDIMIPDSVTSIGYSAFSGCYSLKNFVMSKGITILEDSVFYSCYSLTDIVIPDGMISIGYGVFSDCMSLASIVIPDSVTAIGVSAFYNCYSLTNIVIPDSVTAIGVSAFYNCYSLTSIVIPDSITVIGASAFYNCRSLTSVVIPDSMISIWDNAFYGCELLKSIVIPAEVKRIGSHVFRDSGIWKLVNNDSVVYADNWAVGYKGELKEVSFRFGTVGIADGLFERNSLLRSVVMPDGVINIGSNAFRNCNSLTSVVIPHSVINFGEGSFFGCEVLTDIYYTGTQEQWKAIEKAAALIPNRATVHFNWE